MLWYMKSEKHPGARVREWRQAVHQLRKALMDVFVPVCSCPEVSSNHL